MFFKPGDVIPEGTPINTIAGEETKDPTFINQYTPGKTFARLEVNKISFNQI